MWGVNWSAEHGDPTCTSLCILLLHPHVCSDQEPLLWCIIVIVYYKIFNAAVGPVKQLLINATTHHAQREACSMSPSNGGILWFVTVTRYFEETGYKECLAKAKMSAPLLQQEGVKKSVMVIQSYKQSTLQKQSVFLYLCEMKVFSFSTLHINHNIVSSVLSFRHNYKPLRCIHLIHITSADEQWLNTHTGPLTLHMHTFDGKHCKEVYLYTIWFMMVCVET